MDCIHQDQSFDTPVCNTRKCLTVCSYHVTYLFQSESTLYSCLNVKELLAQNRCKIWSLSDCSGIQTHNHLVCKWTLNQWFVYKLSGCRFVSHCCYVRKCLFLSAMISHVEWRTETNQFFMYHKTQHYCYIPWLAVVKI